ncbi:LETM1-related biofilm-associated protein [Sungkyunkwania multivorans]|uniref:LETM1-related biofilm-associated protein n=1 Tax=Sungkyunkwania multivorans TaxID=1173618 RepID=A0ABW3CWX7_9FLAO
MNPSSAGWIKKLWKLLDEGDAFNGISLNSYYHRLRHSGFIYGTNVSPWLSLKTDHSLTEEEVTKVNLLLALLFTYKQHHPKIDAKRAVSHILEFYKDLKAKKLTMIDKIIAGNKQLVQLEKVLHYRVQANQNIFTRNFSNIITNALLFVDVLAFKAFINGNKEVESYAENLEQSITSVILNALNAKEEKTNYDELLVKLLQSSLRYHQIPEQHSVADLCALVAPYRNTLERLYIMDMAAMAVWNDKALDKREHHFIWALGKDLEIEEEEISFAISFVHGFIMQHQDKISFFNHSNPVKHFYDQSSKMVNMLILRNRKRLTKELTESRELLVLLSKSTSKELDETEKQKVREQLLDICKTIPSLAIFALPGGTVLLPILIKFIPKLLPSAFDDNRVE